MYCEEMAGARSAAGEACEEEFIDDDEEPADLYKGSFSLTYGTVTLLRETKLHLKKFRSYGPGAHQRRRGLRGGVHR